MNGARTHASADVLDELDAQLGGQVEREAPSAALTTYRCGGPLAALVRARTEDDLRRVLAFVVAHDIPVLVIGRGSNLLVADSGFDGIALVLTEEFEHLDVDRRGGRASAGGAVPLPVLARRAAAAGLGGLEFYVGIPGSVGGAVAMNAGGHGSETKDVIIGARVCSLADGHVRELSVGDLDLGYRRSAIGADAVVVSAEFAGHADDPAVCSQRIDEIVRWRREHQPGGQNAGSVFTNPPGDSAGRLIDACGLKQLRVGGVTVSSKHANFFVAEPGASASDVYALAQEVRRRVAAATGVSLEPELHFVGFDIESGR